MGIEVRWFRGGLRRFPLQIACKCPRMNLACVQGNGYV